MLKVVEGVTKKAMFERGKVVEGGGSHKMAAWWEELQDGSRMAEQCGVLAVEKMVMVERRRKNKGKE